MDSPKETIIRQIVPECDFASFMEFYNVLIPLKELASLSQSELANYKSQYMHLFTHKTMSQLDKVLTNAIKTNDLDLVKECMEKGAVDVVSERYFQNIKFFDQVDFLINRGNEKIKNLNFALFSAAQAGQMDMINFFINEGASYFDYALAYAAVNGNKNIVDFFLDKLSQPDSCNTSNRLLPFREKFLDFALCGAILGGHIELMHYLIEKGADNWNWAMGYATRKNNLDLINFFILKGAKDWNFGLCSAATMNNMDLVNFFIHQGAKDIDGAMVCAADGGHLDLMNFFVDKGATAFDTALCCSGKSGNVEVVKFLIDKGAKQLLYPMLSAIKKGNMEIINLLIERGFKQRYVAIFCAKQNHRYDLAKFFEDHEKMNTN